MGVELDRRHGLQAQALSAALSTVAIIPARAGSKGIPGKNLVPVCGQPLVVWSVRQALEDYAAGRNDPAGPLGADEYRLSMDRYGGFVYHELIATLMSHPRLKRS